MTDEQLERQMVEAAAHRYGVQLPNGEFESAMTDLLRAMERMRPFMRGQEGYPWPKLDS